MKQIPLTQGKVAIVDDEDFEYLSQWKWCVNSDGYACAHKNIRMHRVIMNPPDNMQIDHIDGNPLNNKKSNLRMCKHSQNMKNRKTSSNNSSGFRGVGYHVSNKKWQAQIQVDGKQIHLGYFKTPEEASNAYESAAIKYFGDFLRNEEQA